MELLPQAFYVRGAEVVAQQLLGCLMVHEHISGARTTGRVVETEAYLSEGDPACHAARGMTKRNRVMFGSPGKAYIYFTYGMHYCFNVVTASEGIPEAVLIRALEPVEGIDLMLERRGLAELGQSGPNLGKLKQLCSGPAKLVQAMGIKIEQNEADLVTGPIQFYTETGIAVPKQGKLAQNKDLHKKLVLVTQDKQEPGIIATSRIGISSGKDLLLRYYLAGSPWISRK